MLNLVLLNRFNSFFRGYFFSGFFDNFFNASFFSGNLILNVLSAVVCAVNQTRNANDEHIGTEEANKGAGFEITSVQDHKAHHGAKYTDECTDKTIGWIDRRKEAMQDVDNTGCKGIGSDNN